jgi:hypothetical protein
VQAASYEVVFVLLVAAACTLTSVLAVTAATYRILSREHCLRAELLLPRTDRRVGSVAWFQAELEQVCLHIPACGRLIFRFCSLIASKPCSRAQLSSARKCLDQERIWEVQHKAW